MHSEIEIMIASTDDVQDIAQLNALFNGSSDSAEAIAARLADLNRVETVALAKKDGKTVGFALLRIVPCVLYSDPHAELTELFVLEAYRQHGIGKRLVQFMEDLARQHGAQNLLVQTSADNSLALALYHSAGFSEYDISLIKALDAPKENERVATN